ncbi:hypothetical protein KDJ07_gp48 [Arthrobacter phage Urla]|uniref:dATP/dGTP diphosphohydrolase N-terminal domain-containing protein n=1 Tax=Arthrobacter phage Urla TaxID=2047867 RepID=A0A2H4P958_9CAUD|nr:hypothetical protein KDJ07_gp48 [Arthrobacter phage Urla]ATW58762.1 hypothetical protein PHIRE_URLA_48 [Arthrobacter phage Urla]
MARNGHALNCASLMHVDGGWPSPCSCGADLTVEPSESIPVEQVGKLEETEQGLVGLFKLHGVDLTNEQRAAIIEGRIPGFSIGGEEVRSVSETGAEKGVKPARFSLIPVGPLTEVAVHFGRGAQKYEVHNWRKGYEFSKGYDALQRHANAWWSGEDLDPEMQTSHLAAVAFHALALLELHVTHPEMDDRYKEGS